MEELATLYRLGQLYAHNCHNTVARVVFFQDHSFLGELYPTYEGHYDDVVERMIGLGTLPNLNEIQLTAAQHLSMYPSEVKENGECFSSLLSLEKMICKHIESLIFEGGPSQGTINLLADMADKSEQRQYKIGQRIKK